MPTEPTGVVVHEDHVALGRKRSGKSTRELRELGLVPDDGSDQVGDAGSQAQGGLP